MSGVTLGPAGLVAVGWVFQDFHGEAWHSVDSTHWTVDDVLPAITPLKAVAADARRYVAVGLNEKGATAWSSSDGSSWQQTAATAAFSATPLRLTDVIHWAGGFVAAGYQGTEVGTADAAFWASPDGLTWQRSPDSSALHDARAWSVAPGGPGLVAVGTSGPADAPGPSVVWTSRDGLRWSRVPSTPVFEGAVMNAVASVPGLGLVVVGQDKAGDTGAVWTSTDGEHWTRAPSGADLGRPGLQVRMSAVIGGGPGVVAVGFATDDPNDQSHNGAVWTSSDGAAWSRALSGADFIAGELNAVAAWQRGLVAVGATGAPDDYVAGVWTSPATWAP